MQQHSRRSLLQVSKRDPQTVDGHCAYLRRTDGLIMLASVMFRIFLVFSLVSSIETWFFISAMNQKFPTIIFIDLIVST